MQSRVPQPDADELDRDCGVVFPPAFPLIGNAKIRYIAAHRFLRINDGGRDGGGDGKLIESELPNRLENYSCTLRSLYAILRYAIL